MKKEEKNLELKSGQQTTPRRDPSTGDSQNTQKEYYVSQHSKKDWSKYPGDDKGSGRRY